MNSVDGGDSIRFSKSNAAAKHKIETKEEEDKINVPSSIAHPMCDTRQEMQNTQK